MSSPASWEASPEHHAEERIGGASRTLAGVLLLGGLAFPIPLGESLLLSHVLLVAVILLWLLRLMSPDRVRASPASSATILLLLVFGVCVVVQGFFQATPDRFVDESVKISIFFLGAVAISALLGSALWAILPVAALALSVNVLYTWRTAPGTYGADGRLRLDEFGSPNSLAVMIAITVLILIFSGGTSFASSVVSLAKWPVICLLAYVQIQSGSRGGMLGLAVGFAAAMLLGWPRSTGRSVAKAIRIIVAATLAVVILASILEASGHLEPLLGRLDLTAEDADSGRTDIWERLRNEMLESGYAQVVGFGPGSIYLVFPHKVVISGHSMLVSTWYYFGVVGLFSFVVWCVYVWKRALAVRDSHAPLRIGLLACLAFTSTVDNIALSTQALLACSVALAAALTEAGRVAGTHVDPSSEPHPDDDVGLRRMNR